MIITELKTTLFIIFLFAASFSTASCSAQDKVYNSGYNLNSPDQIIILPPVLHEISGITYTGGDLLACIQDENGIIFFYNLQEQKIIKEYIFGKDGDYEDIAYTTDAYYILRSDGVLIKTGGRGNGNIKTESYDTGIPAKNSEGLCYDSKTRSLLIGCKSGLKDTDEFKDKRVIYSFNITSEKLSEKPAYIIQLDDIKEYAQINGIEFPGKKIKFRISAISIHPVTGDLYIIASAGKALCVLDRTGKIKFFGHLNHEIINKPEGITFLPDGDMIISSEGGDKKPALFIFKWKKY